MDQAMESTSAKVRTPDQRLRVFVSSTLEELAPERRAVRAAIEQLRLSPVMFEAGARVHPPRDLYRAYEAQSDVFVGIYWERYGWVAAGMQVSGIEDELRLASGMPRLVYVKEPTENRDPRLHRMLEELRSKSTLSYTTFRDAEHLRELLVDDLAVMLSERFDGSSPEVEPPVPLLPVPAPPTSLVGREQEVVQTLRALESGDRRLVVLTGIGGIGKTRLAVAVAERSRERWRDGVAFVDLSSVTKVSRVPAAVAAALGVVERSRETSLEALARRLRDRHMLLVLDNLEQVAGVAPQLAVLLQQAPNLHILATSRVALRVRSERVVPVRPLALADADTLPQGLGDVPSVRLFLQRARDVSPQFELTPENAPTVAELCRRLDGLPLAIELAAAGIRLHTPRQLLERLDEAMARPHAPVDLPERQRTLAATLRWSYDLLPSEGQQVLARLSVFTGPFTVDAATAVCASDELDVIDGLTALELHSLLSPAERPDGQTAFRLLETVRTFAARQLGDDEGSWLRLEGYLLDVLADAGRAHGSSPESMLRLDSEAGNLQAAVLRAINTGRSPGLLLRSVADTWVWMQVRRHVRQLPELRRVINQSPAAGALSTRDWLAVDRIRAAGLFAEGQYSRAGELVDSMMPDARRLEPAPVWAMLLNYRAVCRPFDDSGPARAEFEEALGALRRADDAMVLSYVLFHFAAYLRLCGETDRAGALVEEGRQVAAGTQDRNLQALAHFAVASQALETGSWEVAVDELRAAARDWGVIGHEDGLARCLALAADLAQRRGHPRLAAELQGAGAGARRKADREAWPLIAEHERRVGQRMNGDLASGDLDHQIRSGSALSVLDALQLAFTALTEQRPAGSGAPPGPAPSWSLRQLLSGPRGGWARLFGRPTAESP